MFASKSLAIPGHAGRLIMSPISAYARLSSHLDIHFKLSIEYNDNKNIG